jgi:hypothetical protein
MYHLEGLQLTTLPRTSIYKYLGIGSDGRTLEGEFLKNIELFF